MKSLYTSLIIFLGVLCSYGQNTVIQGIVTEPGNSDGLIGVTVYPVGKMGNGTATDFDGSYEIKCAIGDTLVYNFLGYIEEKRVVGTQSIIDVVMTAESLELDEVVITALGMKREKKSLGYATQEVDGESISESRELNMVNSLSGKVAGVNITQGGGGLGGGGARIVIRGETSLAGNNGPLFVIDGVPGGSNDVASDDVASVSVLKGPAAAALYGSRAAAGVILITTKSGAGGGKDRIGFEVNMNASFQNPFILPSYQNEFGQGSGGQYKYFDGNNGTWPDGTISNDDSRLNWGPKFDGVDRPQFNGYKPWVAYPNNVRDFYQTGLILNNNVAVYGSNDKGDFRLSYTNIRQKGIIPNTGIGTDRIDFGSSLNLTDKITVRANIKYIESRSDNNRSEDPRLYPRNIDIDALKNYWVPGLEGVQQLKWRASDNNPYFEQYENRNSNDNLRLLGNVTVNYQITDRLSIMGRIGQNRSYSENYNREAFSSVGTNNRFGSFSASQGKSRELNADFLARYQMNIFKDLNAIVSFGGNHLRTDGSNISSNVNQLLIPDIYNLGNRRVYPTTGNGFSEKQLNSLYGFANFAYKNFLYLDVTARNDWSSTLPIDNNSYFYPSFTLSGLVHEVVALPKVISFWKLRGGIARVGNDTGPYALQDGYSWKTGEGGVASIEQSSTKANPDLKPEITSAWEVGTDIRFWNNRIQLDATYYNSLTSNQILRVEVSPTTGYDYFLKNAGKIRSQGVELMVNGRIIEKKKFSWSATLNWSMDRSVVEEYDPENPDAFLSRSVTTHLFVEDKLGERRGAMYGKSFQRAPNGEILFTKSGDTQRGEKAYIGNYNPDWMGSIINDFQYGNFGLSFLVDVRYGGVFYSETNYNLNIRGLSEATLLGGLDPNGNLVPRDYIVPDGMYLDDDGSYKKLTREVLIASGLSSGGLTGQQYWENVMDAEIPEAVIYDASYIKIRELNFSYSFPQEMTKRWKLSGVNAGVVVRNLALWSKVPNVDAETFSKSDQAGNIPGLDSGGIPSVRNISFNLSLKF
ncbi:SusC/RagA family TonB-linked outer membrane protein [Portibacter lacus]|uniref:SusC/RagA family TonB-linked outer membrane protein n=1 Tax=Portibacter lacus TaxID=1099794 RepID=A0AA37SNM5_9BACT|nr:SusC/RagA family TonB-linked outer membrane protein [Portibacter lacus]GLR17896.1 SusC/RagA family TonB-linked outer membrane protein [Portibacter lacus]